MEELKRIFKNSLRTSIVILIYGLLTRNSVMYIGFFMGSLVSVLGLYMMTVDAKKIIYSKNGKRIATLGYLKRYILYGLFLLIMVKLSGLPMMLGSTIGLLNVRLNICYIVVSNNIKKWKDRVLSKWRPKN